MAIFDFSNAEKKDFSQDFMRQEEYTAQAEMPSPVLKPRDRLLSTVAARLFFILLLVVDVIWCAYALTRLGIALLGIGLSWGKLPYFNKLGGNAWVSLRRSLVCGMSLFIALFHPSFGIMIACTYFLMYDKAGIEEVVPSSLQAQFKEFFPQQ